jgi:mitogen-activated protein kinase kinase kinase 10
VRKKRRVSGGGIDVVVKVLHQRKLSPKALTELRQEAVMHHAMRHQNIIQLYGASLRPPHTCLVLEYASHGGLDEVLKREGPPHPAASSGAAGAPGSVSRA